MNTWIALFRGINVGGNNMLPMKQLAVLLEKNGCCDVKTYIQSGNVIFKSSLSDARRVERRLQDAVAEKHGFEPRVIALTLKELEKAAAANPFPGASEDPKSVHLFFLATAPEKADTKGLDGLRKGKERFELKGKVFYLFTPPPMPLGSPGEPRVVSVIDLAERSLGGRDAVRVVPIACSGTSNIRLILLHERLPLASHRDPQRHEAGHEKGDHTDRDDRARAHGG